MLLEAYRLLYPAEAAHTVYAYWSRLAAVKLTADYYKADYFRRFIRHKADQGFSIRQIDVYKRQVHTIQYDVPAGNVIAIYREADDYYAAKH